MKYLVTGISGLLGVNLALFLAEQNDVVGTWHSKTAHDLPFEAYRGDLLDRQFTADLIDSVKPEILIHCAALANIDECERQPELARNLNSDLPGELAELTRRKGIRLVHISTDAVFDGQSEEPYRETDTPNPQSVYTATKLAGEAAVAASNPEAFIARVNLYGWSPDGKRSLAEFFYNRLVSGTPANGFTDVIFCPLYVCILSAVLETVSLTNASGIYHVTSTECLSKYEFGRLIATTFGFNPDLIQPTSWQAGGLVAKRSPNLRLDNSKLRRLLGYDLPGIEAGLEAMQADLKSGYRKKMSEIFNNG